MERAAGRFPAHLAGELQKKISLVTKKKYAKKTNEQKTIDMFSGPIMLSIAEKEECKFFYKNIE